MPGSPDALPPDALPPVAPTPDAPPLRRPDRIEPSALRVAVVTGEDPWRLSRATLDAVLAAAAALQRRGATLLDDTLLDEEFPAHLLGLARQSPMSR